MESEGLNVASFEQESENLIWYLHEWAWELETLKVDHLEYYGLPQESLDLLSVLIEDTKILPEDDEEGVYPNRELIRWFIDLVDKSHSWQEIEDVLRQKLIDSCKITG